MTQFVGIRHQATKAEGTCPVRALPHWEAKGYEAIDQAEVEEARKLDNVTADDVEAAENDAPFTATTASAKDVADYLAGVDRSTPDGQAEYDRVVAEEKASHNDGKGRTTALAGVN